MTVFLKRRSAKELLYTYETRFIPSLVEMNESFSVHYILKGSGGGRFTVEVLEKRLYICGGLLKKPDGIFKSSDKTFEDIELNRLSKELAIERGLVQIDNILTFEKLLSVIEKIN